jgi:hypothetical protein
LAIAGTVGRSGTVSGTDAKSKSLGKHELGTVGRLYSKRPGRCILRMGLLVGKMER